jgi:hypothetical protein
MPRCRCRRVGADSRLSDIVGLIRRGPAVPVLRYGTLAGSVIYYRLFGDPLVDTLAVRAGSATTISSVADRQLSGRTRASCAAVDHLGWSLPLCTPLLVRCFGKLAPIMSGGATAMDTTLPVIAKFSGREMTFVAVISGLVLTLATPVLISMIYRFL